MNRVMSRGMRNGMTIPQQNEDFPKKWNQHYTSTLYIYIYRKHIYLEEEEAHLPHKT